LYLEIFAHVEKLYKNIKYQALEAIGERQGHHRPLGGVAWPHHALADVASLVSPYQSMWVAKKHTLKPSPPLISSQCKDQRQKSGYTWIVGPTNDVSVLKWTNSFIPTLYYTPRGPISKEEGWLISVGSADALPHCPMAHFHQTDSPLDTCKKARFGATWCVDLRRFHWWLIQGLWEALPCIDDMTWSSPCSTSPV
jgi:hypothetical protein